MIILKKNYVDLLIIPTFHDTQVLIGLVLKYDHLNTHLYTNLSQKPLPSKQSSANLKIQIFVILHLLSKKRTKGYIVKID